MHGVIFAELRNYAESKHGAGTWDALLEKANLKGNTYFPVQNYSDSDAIALATAASTLTGLPVTAVLEDFGEFLVPGLIKMYGHLLKPGWKTLEVIDNTEETVHAVVRVKSPGAKPPLLKTVRRSKNEVILIYSSPRKMCPLAIGIGRGLAKHYQERVDITQRSCMHSGAPQCEIVFHRT